MFRQALRIRSFPPLVAGASSALGLACWQREKPVAHCEADAGVLGAAVATGLGVGALGGYLFGKKQGEAQAEKYEKYWPLGT